MGLPTVLVTGGTGFIALEIAHQLLSSGKYEVRATVRNLQNEERNRPLLDLVKDTKQAPPKLVEADLLSSDGWASAVEGVDYVLHTASPFFWGKNEEELVKPAVEGTLNVLKACAAPNSKVKRVVLTSSVAAIAFGRDDLPASHVYTEADWTNPDKSEGYTKSKVLAEKAAWDFVKSNEGHQFELAAINPSLVLGKCRTTPGTSVDIVSQLMTGKIPMLPATNLGVVDVKDVAYAHIAAMEAKEHAAGERFLLSSRIISMREMADMLAAEFQPRGVSVNTKRLPYWLAWTLSWFVGSLKGTVKSWDRELHFDGSKAERTFGFKYADVKATLRETGESLIEAGIVKAK